jgi:hypothetical protein
MPKKPDMPKKPPLAEAVQASQPQPLNPWTIIRKSFDNYVSHLDEVARVPTQQHLHQALDNIVILVQGQAARIKELESAAVEAAKPARKR